MSYANKVKGKNLKFLMPEDYVLLDLETTGLSPRDSHIIEIGAVKVVHHEIIDTYNTLINPPVHISSFITNLTGIHDRMVKDAPSIGEALTSFMEFVGGHIVAGHNVTFDLGFIRVAAEDAGLSFPNDYVDTVWMSRKLFPDMSHSLGDLVSAFGVRNEHAHRALSDVLATKAVYDYMIEYIRSHEITV